MSTVDKTSNISDASYPNAGRIYDFLLGGNHNFEIDRQAAQGVVKLAPFMPKLFRSIRWFLGEAVRRLCDEGFTDFIDFASGLPTEDHIHQIAPDGTKVLYSDIDDVTVAYAQQIIGSNPNIRYIECKAEEPEQLLNSKQVEELFGKHRKVAIGFNGVAWFLPDEKVAHSLKVLYDWADKGSKLFLSDSDIPQMTKECKELADLYKNKMRKTMYLRSRKRTRELIGPWTIVDPGFMPFEEWVDMDKTEMTEKAQGIWGGSATGVILEKK